MGITAPTAAATFVFALLSTAGVGQAAPASKSDAQIAKPLTTAEVLAAASPSDWRRLDDTNTLYLDLDAGRVVIELAPAFAPNHVSAIKAMARNGPVSGAAINRVQDNFVTQWRMTDQPGKPMTAEFSRPSGSDLAFTPLPDRDAYAPQTGFSNGMPAARDPKAGQAWLVHCYGMVGVGRENDANSGDGTELYAVIGHAPRQLDRNITVIGRVVQGMELLSSLRRGTGQMGFYEAPAEQTPIKRVAIASDLPAAERVALEVLRTDTSTFAKLVEARRNRRDAFYHVPAGAIDVCNVPLPVRKAG